jgi:hypothetical protein
MRGADQILKVGHPILLFELESSDAIAGACAPSTHHKKSQSSESNDPTIVHGHGLLIHQSQVVLRTSIDALF